MRASLDDRLIYRFGFVLVAVCLWSGCTNAVTPIRVEEVTEHRFNKNYRLGESMSVNVGEPLVVVQDFWLTTQQGNVAVPNADVDVKIGGYSGALGGPTFVFKRGARYEIKGEKEIDGAVYSIVATEDMIPQNSSSRSTVRFSNNWAGLLVKADGTINPSQMWWQVPANGFVKPASISTPSVSFEREKLQRVVQAKGYENYEIIYTGVNASGLNLTYREFSPEGLARVAFFQNLSYELGVKIISFKKFRIGIEAATSEKITFRILEDGLPKTPVPPTGR